MEPGREVDDFARRVIGAAIEVHREPGPGYTEGVYEEALVVELERRHIPAERQTQVGVVYKGRRVGVGRLDLLVAGVPVVELKTVEGLRPTHKAQLLSYLKATRLQLGLLIDFNVELLRNGIQRVILTQ